MTMILVALVAFLVQFLHSFLATSEIMAIADRNAGRAMVLAALNRTCAVLIIWGVAQFAFGMLIPVVLGDVLATGLAIKGLKFGKFDQ